MATQLDSRAAVLQTVVEITICQCPRCARLFVPGMHVWDERVVRNSFMALDAAEILKIKSGTNLEIDVGAWASEKNEYYSVQSTYMLLKEDQAMEAMAAMNEIGASGDEKA